MGCHTWFYKKIKTPPFEEMKKLVIDTYQKSIDDLTIWINDPECDEYQQMVSAYPEWDIPFITNWRAVDMRRIKMINAGLCKQAIINKYCDFSDISVTHYNGSFYTDAGYHDIFRKYGYPETKLFNLIETLDYINNPENQCTLYDRTVDQLIAFWTKYPDGMIDFG
jgi:hypothetical protein